MRSYETVFALKPELDEEARGVVIDRIKAAIEAAGTITDVDEWGIRKLAYTIDKKYNEAYYVVINFQADKTVLPALAHLYRITDAVIRDIVVSKED